MAMMKKTAEALKEAYEYFGEKEFTRDQWKAHIPLTLETAIKYDAVTVIHHEQRRYYTIQEIVEELNSCAGDDCYRCEWFYQIDEENRVYQLITWKTYEMKRP